MIDRISTLCEAFYNTVERTPDTPAVRTLDGWEMTWREYRDRAEAVAAGFHELGVRPGDTVALMLRTCPEFFILDTAAYLLGAVPFSIYNTAPDADIEHIVANSDTRIAVVEDDFVERVRIARTMRRSQVAEIESLGRASAFDVRAAADRVAPDDLVTIIYTSGTTGVPKGVEITHDNVIQSSNAMREHVGWGQDWNQVHHLPMAHIADRNVSYYWVHQFGGSVTCAPDISNIIEAYRAVEPDFLFAMPRFLERIRNQVESTADADTVRALHIGREVALGIRDEVDEQSAVRLSALRAKFGFSNVSQGFTGGTMTPPDLLSFARGMGLRVGEIWGMSEMTGVVSMTPPDEPRIGAAGKPVPGVELRLADDGELEVRAPWIMRGYRNSPEQTAEVITADGWLRTGDIGTIDADGYVTVIDRKKELIIGSNGKNMAPARIEAQLKENYPLIASVVAVGDQRPYNVAVMALDPDEAAMFARTHGIPDSPLAELVESPALRADIAAQVERANQKLSGPERIRRFFIAPTTWNPGGDELTPTSKIRRRPILKKYAEQIEQLYAQ